MEREPEKLLNPGGLPICARGIILGDIVTDHAMMYPKYRRVGLLAPGREWKVIGCSPGLGGTVTVTGVVQSYGTAADFVENGDTLNITRVKGTQIVGSTVVEPGEPFSSTPLTVTNVAVVTTGEVSVVTFTFAETVPTLALDGYDFVNTATIRPAPWQTWQIQSHTTGVNSDVVIDATTGQLSSVPDAVICECDLFLCQDIVRISGSSNAENNRVFECRADKTSSPSAASPLTHTVKLNANLTEVTAGSLGQITLLLPVPLRVVRTVRAVLRAHSISLAKGNVVRMQRQDPGDPFYEIQHVADVGPPQWFDPITP